jgi:hypothetical protein
MARGLALLALLLALAGAAGAADWGGIEAGVSTVEQVRAGQGAPSRETRAKLEGYDTLQWVYEEDRAPAGIKRMVVDFGLLTPSGYKPSVVRVLTLEPKPGVFNRVIVVNGWGLPDGLDSEGALTRFYYKIGLVVTFNTESGEALSMSFTPPQPGQPAPGAAPRPQPAQPPSPPAPRR